MNSYLESDLIALNNEDQLDYLFDTNQAYQTAKLFEVVPFQGELVFQEVPSEECEIFNTDAQ